LVLSLVTLLSMVDASDTKQTDLGDGNSPPTSPPMDVIPHDPSPALLHVARRKRALHYRSASNDHSKRVSPPPLKSSASWADAIMPWLMMSGVAAHILPQKVLPKAKAKATSYDYDYDFEAEYDTWYDDDDDDDDDDLNM